MHQGNHCEKPSTSGVQQPWAHTQSMIDVKRRFKDHLRSLSGSETYPESDNEDEKFWSNVTLNDIDMVMWRIFYPPQLDHKTCHRSTNYLPVMSISRKRKEGKCVQGVEENLSIDILKTIKLNISWTTNGSVASQKNQNEKKTVIRKYHQNTLYLECTKETIVKKPSTSGVQQPWAHTQSMIEVKRRFKDHLRSLSGSETYPESDNEDEKFWSNVTLNDIDMVIKNENIHKIQEKKQQTDFDTAKTEMIKNCTKYILHNLIVEGNNQIHLLAKVNWFTPLPASIRYHCGEPIEAWNSELNDTFGPSAFIPVHRFYCRFVEADGNSSRQPAVYAQMNEATKSKNKQNTEILSFSNKQEEGTYAETQGGIYNKAGNMRNKQNENHDISR
ncbi:unnamed protein product [Mytilus edulis]|uniref:Uncharacterized protein n=1 Tax=Mytilus edulis TaxID=6550 RepID=A0A8S3QY48_MYTED|nr:unnamed protein product [Mytilus edulis]